MRDRRTNRRRSQFACRTLHPGELERHLVGNDLDTEVAEADPGLATADEAIAAFIADGGDFLADATIEGQQISYEGEVVGRLTVNSLPAGGYLVTSAEWCYPDDY